MKILLVIVAIGSGGFASANVDGWSPRPQPDWDTCWRRVEAIQKAKHLFRAEGGPLVAVTCMLEKYYLEGRF